MSIEPQNHQGGHDMPLTPPPASSPGASGPAASGGVPNAPAPAPQGPRGSGARAGAIAIAVFGGVVLLGTGATAAVAAVHDVSRSTVSGSGEVVSATTAGLSGLDLDVGRTNMSVEFGDVDEATLEVIGTRSDRWTMERNEDELVVRSPGNHFGLFDGRWFGGDWFGGDLFEGEGQVVLTLPESLNDGSLSADFNLGAGSLDIEGDFDEVGIEMGAGSLTMAGAAASVDADISAGHARLDLADVSTADFTIAAGKLIATLTGTTPQEVTVDVSAGTLELTVPDDSYNVSQDVSAGSLDNRLDTSSSSRSTIDATVSAGSAILRPGD